MVRVGAAGLLWLSASTSGAVTSRPGMPIPDDAVQTMTILGNRLYFGGGFQAVGRATQGFVITDALSGVPLSPPLMSGSTNVILPDGQGGWFIGGTFHEIAGLARTNAAHLLADGSVSPWNPEPNGAVLTIAVENGRVYLGGSFTSVDAQPRHYLAAVDSVTGRVLDWDPSPNDFVRQLVVGVGQVFFCGGFHSVGGQPRLLIASADAISGALSPFAPKAFSTSAACSGV